MDQIKMEKVLYIEEVLFGQQKQASQINGGVSVIVAKELMQNGLLDAVVSHSSAEEAIHAYVKGAVEGTYNPDAPAFVLIVGINGRSALASGQPVTVSATPISDESTKVKFTVETLTSSESAVAFDASRKIWKEDSAADRAAGTQEMQSVSSTVNPGKFAPATPDETMGFKEKAEFLVQEISPLVSGGVKAEIPDNVYAQCLVCAEGYFKAKGI